MVEGIKGIEVPIRLIIHVISNLHNTLHIDRLRIDCRETLERLSLGNFSFEPLLGIICHKERMSRA